MGDCRNAVEAALSKARNRHAEDTRPIDQVVDEAVTVLANEGRRLLTLRGEPLRDAVNSLIAEATVDMETKAVDLTVALPTWAIIRKPRDTRKRKTRTKGAFEGNRALCPATPSRSREGDWTQRVAAVVRCDYRWVRGSRTVPPCYDCRRAA
jgi:hypothetical protein